MGRAALEEGQEAGQMGGAALEVSDMGGTFLEVNPEVGYVDRGQPTGD